MHAIKEAVFLATLVAVKFAETLNVDSIANLAMGTGVGSLLLEGSANTILMAMYVP